MPKGIVDTERLKQLASTLELRGETVPFVEAMFEAAAEIETLRFTVEATTKLAQQAAEQSVRDRKMVEDIRDENSRLHNRVVEVTAKLVAAKFSRGY